MDAVTLSIVVATTLVFLIVLGWKAAWFIRKIKEAEPDDAQGTMQKAGQSTGQRAGLRRYKNTGDRTDSTTDQT